MKNNRRKRRGFFRKNKTPRIVRPSYGQRDPCSKKKSSGRAHAQLAPPNPLPSPLNDSSLLPLTFSLNSPREPLLTLYRRISVLDARGESAAASQLGDVQMGPVVDALKATHAITDLELQALIANEKERVTNASVLAELLLPSFTALLETARLAPKQARDSAHSADLAVHAEPQRHASESGQAPAEIADFIDEMLNQQRPPRTRSARAG